MNDELLSYYWYEEYIKTFHFSIQHLYKEAFDKLKNGPKKFIVKAKGDGFCGWRSIALQTTQSKSTFFGMMSPQTITGAILYSTKWWTLTDEQEKTIKTQRQLSSVLPPNPTDSNYFFNGFFESYKRKPQISAAWIYMRTQRVLFMKKRLISLNVKLQQENEATVQKIATVFHFIQELNINRDEIEIAFHQEYPNGLLMANFKTPKTSIEKIITDKETIEYKRVAYEHMNKAGPWFLISNLCIMLEKELDEKRWYYPKKLNTDGLTILKEDVENFVIRTLYKRILQNRLLSLQDISSEDILEIFYFWRILHITKPPDFDYTECITLITLTDFNAYIGTKPVDKQPNLARYLEYLFCFKTGSLSSDNSTNTGTLVSSDQYSTLTDALPHATKNVQDIMQLIHNVDDPSIFNSMVWDEAILLDLEAYRNQRWTERFQIYTFENKTVTADSGPMSNSVRCSITDINHTEMQGVEIPNSELEAVDMRVCCRFGGIKSIETVSLDTGRITGLMGIHASNSVVQTGVVHYYECTTSTQIKDNPFKICDYYISTMKNPNPLTGGVNITLFNNTKGHYEALLEYNTFVQYLHNVDININVDKLKKNMLRKQAAELRRNKQLQAAELRRLKKLEADNMSRLKNRNRCLEDLSSLSPSYGDDTILDMLFSPDYEYRLLGTLQRENPTKIREILEGAIPLGINIKTLVRLSRYETIRAYFDFFRIIKNEGVDIYDIEDLFIMFHRIFGGRIFDIILPILLESGLKVEISSHEIAEKILNFIIKLPETYKNKFLDFYYEMRTMLNGGTSEIIISHLNSITPYLKPEMRYGDIVGLCKAFVILSDHNFVHLTENILNLDKLYVHLDKELGKILSIERLLNVEDNIEKKREELLLIFKDYKKSGKSKKRSGGKSKKRSGGKGGNMSEAEQLKLAIAASIASNNVKGGKKGKSRIWKYELDENNDVVRITDGTETWWKMKETNGKTYWQNFETDERRSSPPI